MTIKLFGCPATQKSKKIFYSIMVTLQIFCPYIFSKVIIWDLGGVLCDPNKFGVARDIGLSRFISYMILDRKNPNIQALLFKILSKIKVEQKKHFKYAETAEGMKLPDVMCLWQAGTIPGPEIIKIANQHIKKLDDMNYFNSKREKILIKRTINAMFNPEILAKNVSPIDKGMKLLKECAKIKNNDGTRKHTLIAFSNWDHLSFEIFYRNNKQLFKYFDAVIISGNIKLIKPHPKSFKYLIETLDLNPEECILLDDQKVNTKGARQCAMKTIHVKNYDFKSARKQLIEFGIELK